MDDTRGTENRANRTVAWSVREAGDAETESLVSKLEGSLYEHVCYGRVVVTGREWVGGSFGGVEAALLDLAARAENELLGTVFSFGYDVERFFDVLFERLSEGVRVTLVVNDLASQPGGVRRKIEALSDRFDYFAAYSFTAADPSGALHAKVFVADRREVLIGSANLSRGGFVNNHEMAVLLGGHVAQDAAARIEKLVMKLPKPQ